MDDLREFLCKKVRVRQVNEWLAVRFCERHLGQLGRRIGFI